MAGKKIKRIGSFFLALVLTMGMQVQAAEEIPENSLWQISQDVGVKEQAAESSEEVGDLKKGMPVIVLEKAEDDWYKIQYQEIAGYVQRKFLENYGAAQDGALEKEFIRVQDENIKFEDEYELIQEQKKSIDIWKAMVIVFIVAIFGIGIFSAIKRKPDDDLD